MIPFEERCYSNHYDEISDDEFSDDEISGDEISASQKHKTGTSQVGTPLRAEKAQKFQKMLTTFS